MLESHHNSARWASASCEPLPVILSDVTIRGRERPWHVTKLMSEAAAWAYHQLGPDYLQFADRMELCATRLEFKCQEVGTEVRKKLSHAKFCHCRFCMTCQWRKSLLLQAQLEEVSSVYLNNNPKHRPIFFTLTIKNVDPEDLPAAIGKMLDGFDRFRRYAAFQKAFTAWTKRLEITRNEVTGQFHPHLHVLVMAPKEYFWKYPPVTLKNGKQVKDKRDVYLHHSDLVSMWGRAMELDYDPWVDIRAVGGGQGRGRKQITPDELRKAVNETAKYLVKPEGIFKLSDDGTCTIEPQVLKALHDSMVGRRTVGFGGEFVELRRQLNHVDPDSEEADLILNKGEELTEDGQVLTPDGELLDVGESWKEVYNRRQVQSHGGKQYVRAYTDRYRDDWAQAGERSGPDRREGSAGPPLASATQSEHRYNTH